MLVTYLRQKKIFLPKIFRKNKGSSSQNQNRKKKLRYVALKEAESHRLSNQPIKIEYFSNSTNKNRVFPILTNQNILIGQNGR